MFHSWNEANGKDKLIDFVEKFWHFDLFTAISIDEFVKEYLVWAYHVFYHLYFPQIAVFVAIEARKKWFMPKTSKSNLHV